MEGVFVDRLGLTRTDAVALLGAHTIGRGNTIFSGHHGIWVDTTAESTVSLVFTLYLINSSSNRLSLNLM